MMVRSDNSWIGVQSYEIESYDLLTEKIVQSCLNPQGESSECNLPRKISLAGTLKVKRLQNFVRIFRIIIQRVDCIVSSRKAQSIILITERRVRIVC